MKGEKMLASELIERLMVRITKHGALPVFDWDNDEITAIQFNKAEKLLYGNCPTAETSFPDRFILRQ
jgi:hypothetical protein